MRYDVMNEYYTEIRLFGKPALFNDIAFGSGDSSERVIFI